MGKDLTKKEFIAKQIELATAQEAEAAARKSASDARAVSENLQYELQIDMLSKRKAALVAELAKEKD